MIHPGKLWFCPFYKIELMRIYWSYVHVYEQFIPEFLVFCIFLYLTHVFKNVPVFHEIKHFGHNYIVLCEVIDPSQTRLVIPHVRIWSWYLEFYQVSYNNQEENSNQIHLDIFFLYGLGSVVLHVTVWRSVACKILNLCCHFPLP